LSPECPPQEHLFFAVLSGLWSVIKGAGGRLHLHDPGLWHAGMIGKVLLEEVEKLARIKARVYVGIYG
jgi:hypothetical protein